MREKEGPWQMPIPPPNNIKVKAKDGDGDGMVKRKVMRGRHTVVKRRIYNKGRSSWVRTRKQNWEVTPNLSTANFNAVLEAGRAKLQ